MSDATVLVVNHTGADPIKSAAEHARKQADQAWAELVEIGRTARAQHEAIDANVTEAVTAAERLEQEAKRREAL